MDNKAIYFPGLNGLRAIAALAVVISHTTLRLKEFNLDPYIFGAFQDGKPQGLSLAGYGVSIFFVLSGFLITYLLQVEKDTHPINIKNFYFRRIFRIWPLYYLYLIICVIIIISIGFELNIKSLLFYIFYAANAPLILFTPIPFLAHYWSLAVEEQFYLFWPWVNKKSKSLITFSLIMVIVLLGTKITLHLFFPNSPWESAIHGTRFHCMMIGAVGALLYKNEHVLFIRFANNKITQCICWFIIFLVAINKYHIASFIDTEIISVVALLLIIGQIKIKNRIVNLEINILSFLGKISYGIYVIHPILIFFFARVFNQLNINTPGKYVLVYSTILSSTIFLSYLTFTYFEKYFLKYKVKFEVIKVRQP